MSWELLWQQIGVGVAAPAIVAYVVAAQWPRWSKVLVAMLASVVFGTVSAAAAGELTADNWVGTVGAAFAASQVAYHTFWKPTGIGDWIEGRGTWLTDLINRFTGGRLEPETPVRMLATVNPLPTLGRIVHYRGNQGLLAARSAQVVATWDSLDPRGVAAGEVPPLTSRLHVHLFVFTPSSQGFFMEYNVPQGMGPDGEPATADNIPPGSWCWPPRV